ncbi:MAG TPA: DUF3048 domain-containing protein [Acidimicrobiia bacterium]|nr:DUF3048 domain-containing protein [Acidimicrobiia bacterium]
MRATSLLVCLALVTVACGGDEAEDTTTTTTLAPTTTTRPTTTTTRPTTTTTIDDRPLSPLTGLPVDDPESLERRALVVKIDNHPSARPQSGLPHADVMLELPVEGITRFVAVFHTEDVAELGPIRSMRPTDWQVAALFGGPLVMSGGQNWVVSQNRNNGAELIGDVGRPVTFRVSFRSAPHNLYGNTEAIRDLADSRGYDDDPPEAIWEFGDMPATAERATEIRLPFSSSLVADWEWTGADYERSTNGAAHDWIDRDGERSRISTDVLVVLQMRTYLAQPPPGGGAARAVESIGSGTAWVFAEGGMVEGSWSRPDSGSGFDLTTDEGDTIEVPAGRVWISFFPSGQTPTWS